MKNIKQKYAIAHSDMIIPFPVLMHWFKTNRNKTVKINPKNANCPNLNVNAFITYLFRRLIIKSSLNINILRSIKRLNNRDPFAVR